MDMGSEAQLANVCPCSTDPETMATPTRVGTHWDCMDLGFEAPLASASSCRTGPETTATWVETH